MPHRFKTWREAIQIAPNSKAVNGIMRDYLEAIRPILPTLPAECQRALSKPELDIQTVAVALLHSELLSRDSEETRDLLHEIAHTFAAASMRITMLHVQRTTTPAD